MAKKPKKAAPEGEDGAAAEAPKSKKKLIIIAAAAILVIGGGAGGFLMMKKPAEAGDQAEAAPAAESGGGHEGGHGGGHGGEAVKKGVAFLEVRDLIVNLTPEPGQSKGGYLKLKVSLELKDAMVEESVKPLLPRVEDTFQTYMRELRASDIAGSAGLYRLREELLRRVNVAIHPAKAEAVLFKDVVVQ